MTQRPALEVRSFAEADLPAAVGLLAAESRHTYTRDPERTLRAFTAPGTTTLLAMEPSGVVGLAFALSDGEINAYLALLVVARDARRGDMGSALAREALRRCGAVRLDLLSECDPFFASLGGEPAAGFRLSAEAPDRGGSAGFSEP